MANLNEHDMTKLMLEVMRTKTSTHKNMITENDNGIIDIDGDELKQQQEAFGEQVSNATQFTGLKVYPNNRNVVFNGKFNNGITWQVSLLDGVYFDTPNMELTDEIAENIKRLNAFQKNFEDEWSKKVDEYINNV